MRYTEIQQFLEKLKIFWVEDLKILDDKYDRSKILKWKNAWYIKQIIRGFYVSSHTTIHQNTLFEISNKIYSPSYISLEMAFSYYKIIPEQAFSITAVSTKKTISFNTELGHFDYKKIKPTLFWWYKTVKIGDSRFNIAELEKAIIDYFYLKDNVKNREDLDALRFDKEAIKEKIDTQKLLKYESIIQSPTLKKRINLLIKYLNND
jgi:predicted transcriptional regulator of viral defense system